MPHASLLPCISSSPPSFSLPLPHLFLFYHFLHVLKHFPEHLLCLEPEGSEDEPGPLEISPWGREESYKYPNHQVPGRTPTFQRKRKLWELFSLSHYSAFLRQEMHNVKGRAFPLFPKESQECPRSEVEEASWSQSLRGRREAGVQQGRLCPFISFIHKRLMEPLAVC